MISKEFFINIIYRLEDYCEKVDEVDRALRQFSSDFNGFFVPQPVEIVVDILTEIFKDNNNHWLEYFVYEKGWLRSFYSGDITDGDSIIEINNWGDVYDFLINNMNNLIENNN